MSYIMNPLLCFAILFAWIRVQDIFQPFLRHFIGCGFPFEEVCIAIRY
jgi:hypothetical protein